jgi:DNA-binding response OmpR family regulator
MGQRILIINKSPDILSLLQVFLEDEGYEVIPRSTAFQKVAEIEAIHPDLILLDGCFGSDHTGWEMIEKLLLHPSTSALPMVILAEERYQHGQNNAHPHVQIVPPLFDLEKLLAQIKQAFEAAS